MVEEVNLAEDRKKKLRKILKTDPEKRSEEDIKLIEALVEVGLLFKFCVHIIKFLKIGQQVPETVQGDS